MIISLLLTYVVIISLLIATPGPLMALTMRNAVRYGYSSVFPTYLGAVVANLIWALAAWLGVSAFFDSFPTLKSPIQMAGAIYLIYLGYQMLISAIRVIGSKTTRDNEVILNSRFAEGFIIDILNPKMIVFYTSFYTQFIVFYLYISTVSIIIFHSVLDRNFHNGGIWLHCYSHSRV
ncbi:LysE family translocator [Fodinicurvata sp. EGI_FJ10296]|uniref:LysE family translocator n=1 Tax=Fodinicurvata sp. EGI_FJ10296 TaxID=3231908 RepID=UPI003456FB3E